MRIKPGRLRIAARHAGIIVLPLLTLALVGSLTAFGAARPERAFPTRMK